LREVFFLSHVQEIRQKLSTPLPRPIPFEDLTFDVLSKCLNDRAMRRISGIASHQIEPCKDPYRPFTPIAHRIWRPNLGESGLEHEFVQFCLARQRERILATVSHIMNELSRKTMSAHRWWVVRFSERQEKELTMQKTLVFERSRCEIVPDHIQRHFDRVLDECRSMECR
jgi:hypothetical protein